MMLGYTAPHRPYGYGRRGVFHGLAIVPSAGVQLSGVFDSWGWRNRKWLVLGGAGAVVLGLAAAAAAVLK